MSTSKAIGGGRSILVAGAAAMVAAGSMLTIAGPPHAQADTRVCTFSSGELRVNRADGQLAVVGTNGATVSGRGDLFLTADNPTNLDTTSGTASGSLKGNHISFTVTPRYQGAKGETYEGEIVYDGSVTGWIQRTTPQINWTSPPGSVTCTTSATPAGGTATVTDDVDVYSRAGGDDQFKLGFLSAGTEVKVAGGGKCPAEGWCHVTGPNVPTGDGYAWGAFFK